MLQNSLSILLSEWAFLEQLALAAIDLGNLKVADVCFHLSRIVRKLSFNVNEKETLCLLILAMSSETW